jgi:hypothetical protein
MSFRKYGGINKYATNSIVHSKINTSSIFMPKSLGPIINVNSIAGINVNSISGINVNSISGINSNSTATFTTFNGNLLLNKDGGGMLIRANGKDIYQNLVISHDTLMPLYESIKDAYGNITYNGICNIIIGNNINIDDNNNITGDGNTCLGYSAGKNLTTGSYNTCIGSHSNIISNNTVNCSTAIGYGATATLSNQIMLGRASETVYCPGETNNLSLKITKNALINGCWFGVGTFATKKNIYIGQPENIIDYAGSYNTIIGQGDDNFFIGNIDGSSGNTLIGANQIISSITTSSSGNTIIGNTIIGSSCYVPPSANNSTCLGKSCNIAPDTTASTAIGYGAKTTMSNQIMLGTATEAVYCPGTVNCLVLNSNLVLPDTNYNKRSNNLGYINRGDRINNNIEITVEPVQIFTYTNVIPGVYIVNCVLYFKPSTEDDIHRLYTNTISVSSYTNQHNVENIYTFYFSYNGSVQTTNTINYSITLKNTLSTNYYLLVSSNITGQIAPNGRNDWATMVRIA